MSQRGIHLTKYLSKNNSGVSGDFTPDLRPKVRIC